MFDYFDIWRDKYSVEELEACLGTNIANPPEEYILIELCEASQRYFYNQRFTTVKIQYPFKDAENNYFRIFVPSLDDSSLNMWWNYKRMNVKPYEAREIVLTYLKRTNYFVTLKGFEFFCSTIIGKPHCIDYN